jgi:hypothetical protein
MTVCGSSQKSAQAEKGWKTTLLHAPVPRKEKRMFSLDDRTGNVLTAVTIVLLAAVILIGEME